MKNVVWERAALDDLEAIGAYIGRDNKAAADRVVQYVMNAARSLEASPELGRYIAKRRVREFVLTRHPYILFYVIVEDDVRILAVHHHRQRR